MFAPRCMLYKRIIQRSLGLSKPKTGFCLHLTRSRVTPVTKGLVYARLFSYEIWLQSEL
jgi:hypothetical protein